MSDLAQYNVKKLVADVERISPGTWVNHIEDRNSWGMVVACAEDQASVLWSRAPKTVPENFAAPTLPLPKNTKVWLHDDLEQVARAYDAGMVSKAYVRERFGIEETYNSFELENEQLDELRKDHAKVTFHENGDVTVEREVDQLPAYVRPEDVRRRRSRY